jgi:hypothetical protein
MEYLSGISIRSILLHNNNWWNFYTKHAHLIRKSIVENICKVLACKTEILGFHSYKCDDCGHDKKVPHTCKSRFCSSCGKKATEQWIQTNMNILPNVPWQHITFTLPQELRDLFWVNRHLINHLIKIPAAMITKLAKYKGLIPAIFLALHTFGRDLKQNVHFHVSTTSGGLSLDHSKWVDGLFLNHQPLKNQWRFHVTTVLKKLYKAGQLILPPALHHINNFTQFNAWISTLYQKTWVVHLQKKSKNHKQNIKYLGRYLKRPPISETKIKQYDGINVTYQYKDHHDNSIDTITMPVDDFIARLIRHIPDKGFRLIRYYNWLSNRTRSTLLPLVYKLINQCPELIKKINWRALFYKTFGKDPLKCPVCDAIMSWIKTTRPTVYSILDNHENIATKIFA